MDYFTLIRIFHEFHEKMLIKEREDRLQKARENMIAARLQVERDENKYRFNQVVDERVERREIRELEAVHATYSKLMFAFKAEENADEANRGIPFSYK